MQVCLLAVEDGSASLLQETQSLVTEEKSEVSSCQFQTMSSEFRELTEKLQASENSCQKLKQELTSLK